MYVAAASGSSTIQHGTCKHTTVLRLLAIASLCFTMYVLAAAPTYILTFCVRPHRQHRSITSILVTNKPFSDACYFCVMCLPRTHILCRYTVWHPAKTLSSLREHKYVRSTWRAAWRSDQHCSSSRLSRSGTFSDVTQALSSLLTGPEHACTISGHTDERRYLV